MAPLMIPSTWGVSTGAGTLAQAICFFIGALKSSRAINTNVSTWQPASGYGMWGLSPTELRSAP